MDVLWFLKETTRFIRQLYEKPAVQFKTIIHQIEGGEERYAPEYSEDGGPRFLAEWQEAYTSCRLSATPAYDALELLRRIMISSRVLLFDAYGPAMCRRWVQAFVLMCVVSLSGAVFAQTQAEQQCDSPDPDLAISGCTVVIQSGRETQRNLAGAFNNRGNAYNGKGEYDRALQDFNEAIRLNPNVAGAFYNRGIAYNGKGEYDRAIEDFNEAIRLNPNYAEAFYNRGITFLALRQEARAAADFAKARTLNPNLPPPK
jgi:tetratricopeptide (TPR) repeat protein